MSKIHESKSFYWYRQGGLWYAFHKKTEKPVWFLLGSLIENGTASQVNKAMGRLEKLGDWEKINGQQPFFEQVQKLLKGANQ